MDANPIPMARTNMCPQQMCSLLEFCRRCTYFVFDGQFYRQIHGTAMGAPISMIVCDACMEDIEEKATTTAPHHPTGSPGTWTIPTKEHVKEFTDF